MTAQPKSDVIVNKVAIAVDESTGEWFEIFAFETERGEYVEVEITKSAARKWQKVLDEVVDRGASLPKDPDQAKKHIEAAIQIVPTVRRIWSAHSGWRPDYTSFVLHGHAPEAFQGEELWPPRWGTKFDRPDFKIVGPLTAWKKYVARPAAGSSRMVTSIAAALAAALLRKVDLQSFALVFNGKAKQGKTVIIAVNGSTIGLGRESELPTWLTTDAALDELARSFNDLPLPMNEIGTMNAAKTKFYERLRHFTYRFSEGKEIRRHSSFVADSNAAGNPATTWRSLMVTCSEYSLAKWAEKAGETRDAGEIARFFDVPHRHRACRTIFDWLEEKNGAREGKRLAQIRLQKLRSDCAKYSGTAFPAFLIYLLAHQEKLADRLVKLMKHFEQLAVTDEMDEALKHAAKNFGIIYAAGVLGIEAGILPWTKELLLNSVLRCFKDGVAELHNPEDELRRGIRRLRRHLTGKSTVDLDAGGKARRRLATADGYRRHTKDGGTEYVIRGETMKTILRDPVVRSAVLNWAVNKGLLAYTKSLPSQAARRKSIEWAERHLTWPNQKRVRSIVFVDPAGNGFKYTR